jgi:hypothetical protein
MRSLRAIRASTPKGGDLGDDRFAFASVISGGSRDAVPSVICCGDEPVESKTDGAMAALISGLTREAIVASNMCVEKFPADASLLADVMGSAMRTSATRDARATRWADGDAVGGIAVVVPSSVVFGERTTSPSLATNGDANAPSCRQIAKSREKVLRTSSCWGDEACIVWRRGAAGEEGEVAPAVTIDRSAISAPTVSTDAMRE